MADPNEISAETRREQHRELAAKRWEGWGAEYDEVIGVLGARAASVLGRKRPLTEQQVLDLTDLTGDLLHPSSRTLDAIKAERPEQGEPS